MLTILDKKYEVEGNKITCQLLVGFTKDCNLLNNKVHGSIVDAVQYNFCGKYKNNLKCGYGFSAEFLVKGVAKCNQSVDEFDKEKGAKIALYRALHKLNTMEMELMNMYSNKVITDVLMKLDTLQEKIRLHIVDNCEILKGLIK